MLNQIVLVGRLASDPVLNNNMSIITLAVPRCFKNENGEYETDFIPCELKNNIASTTTEYCKKGDLLGIKGRLETNMNTLIIVAEKVTYLSASRNESIQ